MWENSQIFVFKKNNKKTFSEGCTQMEGVRPDIPGRRWWLLLFFPHWSKFDGCNTITTV